MGPQQLRDPLPRLITSPFIQQSHPDFTELRLVRGVVPFLMRTVMGAVSGVGSIASQTFASLANGEVNRARRGWRWNMFHNETLVNWQASSFRQVAAVR